MLHKRKILVFVDWYEPGFKAGGPIRSIANLSGALQHQLDIYIVTGDRDVGDTHPYPGITPDLWTAVANHQVYYSSPGSLSYQRILRIIAAVDPDWIYLNAMFSWHFSILPLLTNRFSKKRRAVLLAPRGMLKPSALQFKAAKKTVFLKMYKLAQLHRFVVFQATSDDEEKDIKRVFGNKVRSVLIPNLPGVQKPFALVGHKTKGSVQMIFVGRIHPIKKLDFLLEALMTIEDKVTLSIVGKIDDEAYWDRCKRIINDLKSNISINSFHDIRHSEIENMILERHLFALPTQGENFGHAIFEALAAGRPVLISDQTPWRQLTGKKAGWDLNLHQKEAFAGIIRYVAGMDTEELNSWAFGAWSYCSEFLEKSNVRNLYLKVFSQTDT